MSKGNSPLVGIGMPVYNGAAFIGEALDSILAQTLTDFELVICDNASTDDTARICEAYAARDSRIRFLRNQTNLGAHPNYNRTFRESSGKYFKWAPHDDLLQPTFLEKCVAALEADPSAVLAQTWLDYIDDDREHIGVYDSALTETSGDDAVARFAAVILKPHPAYEVMGLYRRDALAKTQLLGSYHGADRTLLAELALLGSFRQVREPLLVVRDHKQRYTRAQVKPGDRATWHDSKLAGRLSFPTWRIYAEYVAAVRRSDLQPALKWRARLKLLQWWLCNFNAGRMVVDLFAIPFPGIVGVAEKFKQRIFSPAPGADQVREGRAK